MTYTVSQLKVDLQGAIHGTSLNKVQGINQLINRAASTLLLEIDPLETKRIVALSQPIYDHVYDYALPSDLKGEKIIDIRPQANRTSLDRYSPKFGQDFDIQKDFARQPSFHVQYDTANKTLRIENNLLTTGIQINNADTLTGNGTWAASGVATNLRQDNVQSVSGQNSSLEFDISGAGAAALTNSNMAQVDLTNHLNQSSIFFWVYLQSAALTTSVEMRWGSIASAYWTATVAVQHDGTALQDGWNLLRADWVSATKVGSPDVVHVDTLAAIVNSTGIQSGCRLNSVYSRLGEIIECAYYSKYLFRDYNTGAFKEGVTDDSDFINLDTEARNLLFYLVGSLAVQQIQGLDAMFYDSNYFSASYDRALATYKSQYKSEWQRPKSTYYRMPKGTYHGFSWQRFNY